MRIIFLVFLFLGIGYCVLGQDKVFRFSPKWKVGDKKTISTTQHEIEYKNGELVSDTTTTLSAGVEVLKENAESYFIKIRYENIAIRSVANFYDKLDEELDAYKDLVLQYQVNKKTGKAKLTNWKEAQKFINVSFDKVNALLKKKVPEMAETAALVMGPIKTMFSSKENVEAYMDEEIGYLLVPYDKNWKMGDTLRVTESCLNPLTQKDTVSQTTLFYLSGVNEAKKSCTISSTELYDMEEFKNMMRVMVQKMAKSFGVADSSINKSMKEIDNISFDVSNLTTITFNYKHSWPTTVVKSGYVIAGSAKEKSEKKVVRTSIIK